MVTDRSAVGTCTVVVAVPLSLPGFGSDVAEVAVAVFERTVPFATEESTATVRVKTALPAAREAMEQETVPAAPTAGVVQLQPPGELSETKVVPAGRVSESDTEAALLGPLLVTVMV